MTRGASLGDGAGALQVEAPAVPDEDREWAGLLRYLHTVRGFDFHGYKVNTLMRRIRKRMSTLGVGTYAGYQDHLEVHPDEFARLFNTILINVTGFFRDAAAWDVIRSQVIPQLLDAKGENDPIRIWSAGCASGEEAYTIAMLVADAVGRERFRERVKIYATDLDEEALIVARHGAYTPSQVEGVPEELLERYFDQIDGIHVFRHDLRRQVIFGRHDIIHDAPISRIDLLLCRNTLMYFNAETQARVLSRLHFALQEGGFLFLGRAETLLTHSLAFQAVDLKHRISRKMGRGSPRDTRPIRVRDDAAPPPVPPRTQFAALEGSPVAQIVVDTAGILVLANDRARSLLDLRALDIGQTLRDLQLSCGPVELHALIERSGAERRALTVKDVEWVLQQEDVRWFDLHVTPLADASGAAVGTAMTFIDVSLCRRLQGELEESHHKLEAAYEEVQATYQELQSTNEELETTNEELQSTVQELETTNAELQSTSEEMEGMNQELQSTNEELHTINDELRRRGDELNRANAFVQSILRSLHIGVAVLDSDLRVLAWNSRAEDLWGLRPENVVGKHFLGLDLGLPVDRLQDALRTCLDGDGRSGQMSFDGETRRGSAVRCEVTVTPLLDDGTGIEGLIVLMAEAGEERA